MADRKKRFNEEAPDEAISITKQATKAEVKERRQASKKPDDQEVEQ